MCLNCQFGQQQVLPSYYGLLSLLVPPQLPPPLPSPTPMAPLPLPPTFHHAPRIPNKQPSGCRDFNRHRRGNGSSCSRGKSQNIVVELFVNFALCHWNIGGSHVAKGCIKHKPGWFFKLSTKLANLGPIYRQGGLGRGERKAIKLNIYKKTFQASSHWGG